jgi:uncharacterized membrane protein YhdT
MSKLHKAAWSNLVKVTICFILSIMCLLILIRLNAKGIEYLLVCFVLACITTPVFFILYRKKSIEAGFDEREKMINRRAFSCAVMGLVVFLVCICFFPFFILGGQNEIKVYYLPLIFFSAIFAAQFVHSMAILIQCALEDDDGQ